MQTIYVSNKGEDKNDGLTSQIASPLVEAPTGGLQGQSSHVSNGRQGDAHKAQV